MNSRRLVFVVLAVLLSVGLTLLVIDTIYVVHYYWLAALLSLGPEFVGAAVTYFLFDRFIERPRRLEAERQRKEDEKAKLIAEMGSSVNDVAKAAADKLRQRGWLKEGSLRGAYLVGANLAGANLSGAGLRGASLTGADLNAAYLRGADLNAAYLVGTGLNGADLNGAILNGAILNGAKFDKDTTLPDNTKWTPDTDLARFTDTDHPDFWRSDDPSSPAYRGKGESGERP